MQGFSPKGQPTRTNPYPPKTKKENDILLGYCLAYASLRSWREVAVEWVFELLYRMATGIALSKIGEVGRDTICKGFYVTA